MAGLSRRTSANGGGDVQLQEVRFFASDTRPTFSPPRPSTTLHNGSPHSGASSRSSQVHPQAHLQTQSPTVAPAVGVVNRAFNQSIVALDKEPTTYENGAAFEQQRQQRPLSSNTRAAPAPNGGSRELPQVNGHQLRANDPIAAIARSTTTTTPTGLADPAAEQSRIDSTNNTSHFVADSSLSARTGHQLLRTRQRNPNQS